MRNRVSYSYAVLRYVHDIATGEFVNVGVVVMSPDNGFLKFAFRKTAGRITDIFPDIKAADFKQTLNHFARHCERLAAAWRGPLFSETKEKSLNALLISILPKDDSAFVWGAVAGGLSTDLDATLSLIYESYVGKYDRDRPKTGRSDHDVWRAVRKSLDNRQLLSYFEEKIIHGKNDDIAFSLAWKNGIWHCIEPISFDLSVAESIREKAHKRAGEIVGISDSVDEFKVYLVIGEPSNQELVPAYERAIGILQNVPKTEVFSEHEAEALFDKLGRQIGLHAV